MKKTRLLEKIKQNYQELDEEKKKVIKRLVFISIIWILILCIILIVLAAQGLIQDIPWFMYSDFRYIGSTLGAICIGLYGLNYIVYSISKRKKSSKPPRFVYYLYFGVIVYLTILISFPFGSIY